MKKVKYITTKNHPLLRDDLEINNNERDDDMLNLYNINGVFYQAFMIDKVLEWLKKGWIKDIQEKEFTKDDMINFAKDVLLNEDCKVDSYFIKWIKYCKK